MTPGLDRRHLQLANEDRRNILLAPECLRQRVSEWKFRPSSEAVEVTFPFVFKERK